jgi:hypothetical protein
MQRSGNILLTAQLAQDYGFVDIDGKIIRPLTLAEAWRSSYKETIQKQVRLASTCF